MDKFNVYQSLMLTKYINWRLTGLCRDGEFTGLILSGPGGKREILWVQADAEGNAPGFLMPHDISDM